VLGLKEPSKFIVKFVCGKKPGCEGYFEHDGLREHVLSGCNGTLGWYNQSMD